MKVIVGIDLEQAYKPALSLLKRLQFQNPFVTLLHAANEHLTSSMDPNGLGKLQEEYTEVVQGLGSQALKEARDHCCENGLDCRSKLTFGSPANCLIEEAVSQKADLISCCSTHHGSWSSSFLGSTSRSLATGCPISVLIAKAEAKGTGPLTVVFATDHSAYSDRCLDQFIKLDPKGIGTVHLVSAYRVDDHAAEVLNKNLAMLGGDADRWLEEQAESRTDSDALKLRCAGFEVVPHAVRGKTNDVLREMMQETSADLMIVGSHGKGYLERALIGSTSLHQVMCEPYNVLVLRP